MNKLIVVLLVLFIWLQYSLWLGKNGVSDFIHARDVVRLYKNTNNILNMQACNNQLLCEIDDLINGYEAIEERSRYDLGMIKYDETFYQIKLHDHCFN